MIFHRAAPPLPRPDFVARAPSHRRLALLLAVAAALWLAGALVDLLDRQGRVDAARSERSRWEARLAQLRAEQARRDVPALPDGLRTKAARVGEALQFPWAGTLAALESASPDGLRWLALDVDRERGRFRLEGIAVDVAAALATGDAVAALPDVVDVVTARLAALEGAPGQRFEVTGRLPGRGAAAPDKAP